MARGGKRIQYLFDSSGRHIANWAGRRLYAPTGEMIGYYLPAHAIFVDLSGEYLGEIRRGNRLMKRASPPCRDRTFRTPTKSKDAEARGRHESLGSVGKVPGYDDVTKSVSQSEGGSAGG